METMKSTKYLKIFLLTAILVFASTMSVPGLTMIAKSDPHPTPPPLEGDANYATLLATETHTKLYCARFEQSSHWDTEIRILNPNSVAANVLIKFHDDGGSWDSNSGHIILPYNTFSFRPRQLGCFDETGSVIVESDIGVVGAWIRYSQYSAAASLLQPLPPSPFAPLYGPEFKDNGNWDTYIALNNKANTPMSANAFFYDTFGNPIHNEPLTFAAHQTHYLDVSDYPNAAGGQGSIEIKPAPPFQEGLVGFVLVTDGDKAYAYNLQSDHSPTAVSNYFIYSEGNINRDTQIVVTNPNLNSINLNFEFYHEDGSFVAADTTLIPPQASFSIYPSLYVGLPGGNNAHGSVHLEGIGTPSSSFVGFGLVDCTNGASFAAELMIEPGEILYNPAYRDTLIDGDWGGAIEITNPQYVQTTIDALIKQINGEDILDTTIDIPPYAIDHIDPPNLIEDPIHDGFGIIESILAAHGIAIQLLRTSGCGNCNGDGCNHGAHCDCDGNDCDDNTGGGSGVVTCECGCVGNGIPEECEDACRENLIHGHCEIHGADRHGACSSHHGCGGGGCPPSEVEGGCPNICDVAPDCEDTPDEDENPPCGAAQRCSIAGCSRSGCDDNACTGNQCSNAESWQCNELPASCDVGENGEDCENDRQLMNWCSCEDMCGNYPTIPPGAPPCGQQITDELCRCKNGGTVACGGGYVGCMFYECDTLECTGNCP